MVILKDMSQKIFAIVRKVLKGILILALGLITYFIIGILWPQIDLVKPPRSYDKILLTNTSIIDALNDTVLMHQSIRIKDGIIIDISESSDILKNIDNNKVIDLEGQFVMPGLWDMHCHTTKFSPRYHYPLLIANGVTGIREMGLSSTDKEDPFFTQMEDKQIWNGQVEQGQLVGPKIMAIASHVIEDESSLESFEGSGLQEKIRLFVSESKERGADFIKIQLKGSNSSEIFRLIIKEKNGLDVVGHQPEGLSIKEASMLGLRSLEHARAVLNENKTPQDSTLSPNTLLKSLASRYNHPDMTDLYNTLKNNNTYYCPTHLTRKWEANFRNNTYLNDERLKFVPNIQRIMWWIDQRMMNSIVKGETSGLKSFYTKGLEITKDAHHEGVKIMAGTDALDSYIFYGFSLHDELGELVKAGLSPAEAIVTATYNPAQFLNMDDTHGGIKEGKAAELIVLSSNPLLDISNTKSIEMVIQGNRIYDSKELKKLENSVLKSVKELGNNSKIIWALVKSLL